MSDDEDSWECIWPPEITCDVSFIKVAISVLMRTELFPSHSRAWDIITHKKGAGLHSRLTLLEELRDKGGKISQPFIDEAVARIFGDDNLRATPGLADTISDILLSGPSSGCECNTDDDLFEESLRDARADDLFRGCVWELTAMMTACILGLKNKCTRIPASCFEPTDRARFISTFIV